MTKVRNNVTGIQGTTAKQKGNNNAYFTYMVPNLDSLRLTQLLKGCTLQKHNGYKNLKLRKITKVGANCIKNYLESMLRRTELYL